MGLGHRGFKVPFLAAWVAGRLIITHEPRLPPLCLSPVHAANPCAPRFLQPRASPGSNPRTVATRHVSIYPSYIYNFRLLRGCARPSTPMTERVGLQMESIMLSPGGHNNLVGCPRQLSVQCKRVVAPGCRRVGYIARGVSNACHYWSLSGVRSRLDGYGVIFVKLRPRIPVDRRLGRVRKVVSQALRRRRRLF